MMSSKLPLAMSSLALLVAFYAVFESHRGQSTYHSAHIAKKDILRVAQTSAPELMEAIQNGMTLSAQKKMQEALAAADHSALFPATTSRYLGNKDGSIVLAEFVDYNCGYCKMAHKNVLKALEKHPNLKVVIHEVSLFGPVSEKASLLAMAAARQGKYQQIHSALMSNEKPLATEDDLTAFAQQQGLDTKQLQADMKDPALAAELAASISLAESLGLQGTPAFVTSTTIVPGMVTGEKFDELISSAAQP